MVEEVVALPGEPGSGLPAEEWVERRVPRPETLRRVESEMTEGRGEKEAIALALDLSALIVLDDKDVDKVLQALREGNCGVAGRGVYWVTDVERQGRL